MRNICQKVNKGVRVLPLTVKFISAVRKAEQRRKRDGRRCYLLMYNGKLVVCTLKEYNILHKAHRIKGVEKFTEKGLQQASFYFTSTRKSPRRANLREKLVKYIRYCYVNGKA